MAITQKNREIAIATPLGEDKLLLRSMSGTEQLGRPFEYQLELASEDHQIKAEDIVGKNVTIRLDLLTGEARYFNGHISRFTQLIASGGLARYRASMVPWLWFLTRTADCRIFQEMTVPDIIMQVFRDRGFSDFDKNISDYRTWEYCAQYRETDFNFVSRLMEQEGIYYFFKHEDGKHLLFLADSASAHEPYPEFGELKYHPADAGVSDEQYISDWTVETCVQPGSYALKDFDFKKPRVDLSARVIANREHEAEVLEIYDYPGEYTETDDGNEYVGKRIEELQAQYEVITAGSDARGICTGCNFTLIDHPRDDQNREYLITSANYNINTGEFYSGGEGGGCVYSCSFTAIAIETAFDPAHPFRSPRISPKPSIPGPQTAMVVGPSGEEIYTDKYGRVKVQFHWDLLGEADENSSCWIRVAQVWAGKNWGAMYIPRTGQEVIVEFLEGDPDRPIITGRVYNAEAMPPYVLPGEKTKSTLKSNSSQGGGGFNEIRFEDKKGEEQIFIHGEKNLDIRVKNDRFETVINNRHLHVEKDKFEHVDNNRNEKVDADHMEEIGKDRQLKITGKEAKEVGGSHSFTVTGDVIEVFKANHSEQTTQNYYLKAMSVVIEAMQGITLKSGSNSVVVDQSGVTVSGMKVTIDGKMTMINSGPGSPAASGSAGSAVAPAAVSLAEDADIADPGKMAEIKAEQQQKKAGKYGSTPVKPFKPPAEEEEEEKKEELSWIEIELVGEDDEGIPGEKYKITLPDDSVAEGTLDEKGFARVEGFDKGTCKICFPELDKEAWEEA